MFSPGHPLTSAAFSGFHAMECVLQVDLGPYLSGTNDAFKACIERGINGIKTKHEWNVGTGKAHADVLLHPSSQVTDGWLHKPEGNSTLF